MVHAPPMGNASEWNASDFAVATAFEPHRNYKSDVARGFYVNQVKGYMNYFPLGSSLKIIRYEHFVNNRNLVVNEILDFVGAAPHNFDADELEKQLGPIEVKAWYPPMNNRSRTYLKHLYKPFNDELADLLGEEWRGVWD